MLLPRLQSRLQSCEEKRLLEAVQPFYIVLHSCTLAAFLVQTDFPLSMENPYCLKESRQAREQDISKQVPRI